MSDTIVETSVSSVFQQDALMNSNAYFQRDINGWEAFQCTIAHSTTEAHEGTGSLLATPTGGLSSAIAQTTNAASPSVQPGSSYTFTAYMFSVLAWANNELVITWKNDANTTLSSTVGASFNHPGGSWEALTPLTATAPAGATKAQLRIRKSGTPPASQLFYVDEVFLVPTGTPTITTARGYISPQVYGTRWRVERMATSTTSPAETTLRVYRNEEQPGRLLDSTFCGNQDTSDTVIEMQTTEKLLFVWSNGTPLAIATATVSGKQLGR